MAANSLADKTNSLFVIPCVSGIDIDCGKDDIISALRRLLTSLHTKLQSWDARLSNMCVL